LKIRILCWQLGCQCEVGDAVFDEFHDSFGRLSSWASAHMGKWGQLTPHPRKMDEKLKSENMQKEQFLYVYVIF